MAKQVVNIGSAPGDGTGDQARTAFDKLNDNFDEVYTAFGDGTTLGSVTVNFATVSAVSGDWRGVGAETLATATTALQAGSGGGSATWPVSGTPAVITNTTAAFTTAQETKLSGIATAATANATDAALRDRATHTGTHPLSVLSQSGAASGQVAAWNGSAWAPASPAGGGTVTSVGLASSTGLTFTGSPVTGSGTITAVVTYGTGANTICQGNDARLSDSREWTGATVDQPEAEAGTATTRRAWTAQRVAQAIDAQTGDTLADWRGAGSETLIAATAALDSSVDSLSAQVTALDAALISYGDLFVFTRDFDTNENDTRVVSLQGEGTYTPRTDQTVLWRGYSVKPTNMATNDIWLGAPEFIVVAVSDETTALTTGAAKRTFRMPGAFTLVGVRASVTTAPTGSVLTVDINEAGTTVLSTKLTIDAAARTSVGATTPPVISDSAIAADAEITIDIDTVGSSVAGAGLKVTLIGYFT